eukprot:833393-Prymnesium_polylepis.1
MSAAIARLDDLRGKYVELLKLCSERDELFVSQNDRCLQAAADASRPREADDGFGSASLREALREHPQHFSSGSSSLETEDILEALTQIDEAIGALTTIALASATPGACSSS